MVAAKKMNLFLGGGSKLRIKKNKHKHILPCPKSHPRGEMGPGEFLDMNFWGKNCVYLLLYLLIMQMGIGNRVLSLGTKQFGVNTSYARSCLGMPIATWQSHKKLDLPS